MLDKYFSVLPEDAASNDVFYLKSLSEPPSNPNAPWFTLAPIGKNKLGDTIKDMCKETGLARYTNHSLRAYETTTMYQAGVSEKLIQQRTGHRSLDALRKYEHTSEMQLLNVSNVLSGSKCRGVIPPPIPLSIARRMLCSNLHYQ